jgi:hypothetical protein
MYDQDGIASTVLVEKTWIRKEYFDNNHLVESWDQISQQNQWLSVSVGVRKTRRKNAFLGLKLPLARWIYTVPNMDESAEGKKSLDQFLQALRETKISSPEGTNHMTGW